MADQLNSKQATGADDDSGGDSPNNELDHDFELTMFGKGAMSVGFIACFVELAIASGVKLEEWSTHASLWRSFMWRFAFALVCLRVWVLLTCKLGARLAAQWTGLFTDFIMRPCKMEKRARFSSLFLKNFKPGGLWDLDSQFFQILHDEADGVSGYVWVLAAAWVAALWSGIPLIQTLTRFPHLILAWATWRFATILIRGVDTISNRVIEQDFPLIDGSAVAGMSKFFKVLVVVLSALFVLQNIGLDVSACWAGLGITGILVGLSSQTILVDMFAWLFLITQKPFVTEDFVTLGDYTGTVEKINFLTTKLRAPPGELVTLRNKNIIDGNIVNLQYMPDRRYDFEFEVSALCSADLLAKVPCLAKEAVAEQDKCTYQNCWLECLGPFGFKFVLQFWAHMKDVQEARVASTEVWLRLLGSLKQEGIGLASADRLQRGLVQ